MAATEQIFSPRPIAKRLPSIPMLVEAEPKVSKEDILLVKTIWNKILESKIERESVSFSVPNFPHSSEQDSEQPGACNISSGATTAETLSPKSDVLSPTPFPPLSLTTDSLPLTGSFSALRQQASIMKRKIRERTKEQHQPFNEFCQDFLEILKHQDPIIKGILADKALGKQLDYVKSYLYCITQFLEYSVNHENEIFEIKIRNFASLHVNMNLSYKKLVVLETVFLKTFKQTLEALSINFSLEIGKAWKAVIAVITYHIHSILLNSTTPKRSNRLQTTVRRAQTTPPPPQALASGLTPDLNPHLLIQEPTQRPMQGQTLEPIQESMQLQQPAHPQPTVQPQPNTILFSLSSQHPQPQQNMQVTGKPGIKIEKVENQKGLGFCCKCCCCCCCCRKFGHR